MNIKEKIKNYIGRLNGASRQSDQRDRYAKITWALLRLYRFIQITGREFFADRLLLRSIALTFATLLSVIPVLAISFSMFKLFGGGEWFMEVLRPVLMQNLAPGSEQLITHRIEELITASGGITAGGIGLIFLLFIVYAIFTAIESTFNLIWGVSSQAGVLRRLSIYWGLVTIIPILLISSLALTTYLLALPMVHQAVERVDFAKNLVNRMLPGFMVTLSFFLLYKFLPSARVKTHAALTGAVIAGIIYEMFKFIFIFYTGKLVKYDVIYGSLAVVPLLMVWVNISWVVALIGVEVCYVAQHFKMLFHKHKHVVFSRPQKDALAYLILTQITLAFRGKRDPVTIHEWSDLSGAPPDIIRKVVDKLHRGGIVETVGKNDEVVILARDPDFIRVDEIDMILSGEAHEKWAWPSDPVWKKLKKWMRQRRKTAEEITNSITLGELVQKLEKSTGETGEIIPL